MAAIGLTLMTAARVSPSTDNDLSDLPLWLCISGLLGVFAVGYPGYFVFDAIWPSFYYSPVADGKNAWLIGQAFFIGIYFAGMMFALAGVRRDLDALSSVS